MNGVVHQHEPIPLISWTWFFCGTSTRLKASKSGKGLHRKSMSMSTMMMMMMMLMLTLPLTVTRRRRRTTTARMILVLLVLVAENNASQASRWSSPLGLQRASWRPPERSDRNRCLFSDTAVPWPHPAAKGHQWCDWAPRPMQKLLSEDPNPGSAKCDCLICCFLSTAVQPRSSQPLMKYVTTRCQTLLPSHFATSLLRRPRHPPPSHRRPGTAV